MSKSLHRVNKFTRLLIILFLAAVLGLTASVKASHAAAGDGSWLKGDGLGSAMAPSPTSLTVDNVPGPRQYNVMELFSDWGYKPFYYGEKGDSNGWLFPIYETDPGRAAPFKIDLAKAEAQRQFSTVWGSAGYKVMVALPYLTTAMLENIGQGIASLAFSSSLICDPQQQQQTVCIDLLSSIGGKQNSDSSIIKSLTESLFFPCLALSIILTGVRVLWLGLKERKQREALISAGYTILAAIFFAGLLSSPATLARMPMAVNNAGISCLVGAIGGQGCGTAPVQMGQGKTGVCSAGSASTSPDDKAALLSSNLNCLLYRSFVLDPYSRAIFGRNFTDLNMDSPVMSKALHEAGLTAADFNVPLNAPDLSKGMNSSDITLSGNSVQNLLVYTMYLQSGMRGGADQAGAWTYPADYHPGDMKNPDKRWYKIIAVAMTDETMWAAFTSSSVGISSVVLGSIAAVFGIVMTVLLGVPAIMYAITGVILMSFAPIFLLIGTFPGKGKQVMLSWVSKVLTATGKYIITAAFLLVYLMIQGTAVSAAKNFMAGFIILLVIFLAMFTYRKEFINLFGRIEMGIPGLMDKGLTGGAATRRGQKFKKMGIALTGAGAAGALAGGSARASMGAAANRVLARGNGFTANAVKELNRMKGEELSSLGQQSRQASDQERIERQSVLDAAAYDQNVATQSYLAEQEILHQQLGNLDAKETAIKDQQHQLRQDLTVNLHQVNRQVAAADNLYQRTVNNAERVYDKDVKLAETQFNTATSKATPVDASPVQQKLWEEYATARRNTVTTGDNTSELAARKKLEQSYTIHRDGMEVLDLQMMGQVAKFNDEVDKANQVYQESIAKAEKQRNSVQANAAAERVKARQLAADRRTSLNRDYNAQDAALQQDLDTVRSERATVYGKISASKDNLAMAQADVANAKNSALQEAAERREAAQGKIDQEREGLNKAFPLRNLRQQHKKGK